MAVLKGYWRSVGESFDFHGNRTINGISVSLRDQPSHNSFFDYTFSVTSKNGELSLNGFIESFVLHLPYRRLILKVYHDRNSDLLFDKKIKHFPRPTTDPLIGKFRIPATDPWYQRANHGRRLLTSSDGIGKAKFKYKTVKTKDDDGSVTERIKITDMIFKETRPFTSTALTEDILFTDNILFQANPDL
jgi:hypothetical protein